jgi:NAD(P)-dependent dehydrogenase (short-subunit alcohol dehydrogenase family)
MDLKNKVAIVTGGGSGLGEATAIKLAEGGAYSSLREQTHHFDLLSVLLAAILYSTMRT